MYLDKPMKNHTLLQAICRTNRTYNENKKCGLIVDFVGVFENVAKSLAFDEESVKTIIKTKFKKFAEKLDELRERMEQNLITSIEYLKQLLQMARELLEAEKEMEQPKDKREQARAALTDLFQSIKTEDTPFIVEQVVNDIDNEVVKIIRLFNDAFKSVTARREIKKKLRSILWIKYQIKDNEVFEKAYQYIEMYY